MKRPEHIWECDYAHDRRSHRHRCKGCRKILNEGERVIMCRTRRGAVAAHVACGTNDHGSGWTLRDAFEAWGIENLIACGWKIDRHPMSYSQALGPNATLAMMPWASAPMRAAQ